MIRYRGHHYSFRKRDSNEYRKRWVCTNSHGGCNASLITIDDVIVKIDQLTFVISRKGNKMIRYRGHHYSFRKSDSTEYRKRWVCTNQRGGCNASLITIDDVIVKIRTVSFVLSRKGNLMAQCLGYNFSLDKYHSVGVKKRWICTKTHYGCKAYLITIEEEVVKMGNAHSH
ncbi:unnamed protein product [Pieris macdunnoughi]|uniref:FLYWCH-type domain-containing protein n=1 Tax=Pieris macdunnoughi TaxID=345717 RepID=A0A821Q4M9_9NEOP|nr:unnamed protein product [Pieris macdunnoughi]